MAFTDRRDQRPLTSTTAAVTTIHHPGGRHPGAPGAFQELSSGPCTSPGMVQPLAASDCRVPLAALGEVLADRLPQP